MLSFYTFLERPFWQQCGLILMILIGLSVFADFFYFSSKRELLKQDASTIATSQQKVALLNQKLAQYPAYQDLENTHQALLDQWLFEETKPTTVSATLTTLITKTSCQLVLLRFSPRQKNAPAFWWVEIIGNFDDLWSLIQKISASLPGFPISQITFKQQQQTLQLFLKIDHIDKTRKTL